MQSGAIAFIETMDSSSLSDVTQEVFEKNVETAIQDLPPSPSTKTSRPLGPTEMSPFAPSTPGEEPARQLSLNASFPALDNTKRFFLRTGSSVQEAVSKPLNAIGKILENIQQQEEAGEMTPRSTRIRAVTPESPSSRFSHLGISPEFNPDSGT